MEKNLLKQELTKSISIEIIPVEGKTDITERVWAINWFNYNKKWLYNLYNKLAAKYVIGVGGELLFKGNNQKTLFGDASFARQTLLIVTYPQISNFLEMLSIKTFQLLSLLRVKAVKDFVFGFTKRVDNYESTSTPAIHENYTYLVFHYQSKINQTAVGQLAASQELKIYFNGEKLAQIKRLEQGKNDVIAPFFMDGIIVFESRGEVDFDTFVHSDEFLKISQSTTNSYAAIFNRIK